MSSSLNLGAIRELSLNEIEIVNGGGDAADAYGIGLGVGTAAGAIAGEVGTAGIAAGAGFGAAVGAVVTTGFLAGYYGATALGAGSLGASFGSWLYDWVTI